MKLLIGLLMAPALLLAAPAMAQTATTATSTKGTGGKADYTKTVTSPVTVSANGKVTAITVRIYGHQTYETYGEGSTYTLTHNGTSVKLVEGKCPARNGQFVILDSTYLKYADMPRTCYAAGTTTFQPFEALSAFNGQDSSGTWTLTAGHKTSLGSRFDSWDMDVSYNTPQWATGNWSAWSETCGEGTRTRTVTCALNGTTYPEAQCYGSKPSTSETATQNSGCSYSWVAATWKPVYEPNSYCGAKTESTTYTCRRQDGMTVPDSACTTAKPSTTRPYNDPVQCTYSWVADQWNTPTATTCGTTTRTRAVRCSEDTSPGFTKDESLCLASAPKPATSEQVSDYSKCGYGWYRTGYEISGCQNGSQTYRGYYSCQRSDGTAAEGFCGNNPPRWVVTKSCDYWRENWGVGDWYGGIYPGSSTGIGGYSPTGSNYGSGIVSPGADGQSGDPVGIGNSGTGTGTGGSSPVTTGGTYDPLKDVYTDPKGDKYTGGYYDNGTGGYYGGGIVAPPPPAPAAGSVVMMRRPVPPRGR